MKEVTKEEALREVFGRIPISSRARLWKHRLKVGTLSSETCDLILKNNGYIISQPMLYKRG